MWKLFIFQGVMHHKYLCPRVTRRLLCPDSLMCQHSPKGRVYIIFPLKKPICFIRSRSKIWLVQSRSKCFFVVEKNVVPVEDIIKTRNFNDTLTEEARYNERIWCHYIERDFKIHPNYLNELNNGFTWMKCFTQGCHKVAKCGILKISNGKMVQKCNALFRVEEISSF